MGGNVAPRLSTFTRIDENMRNEGAAKVGRKLRRWWRERKGGRLLNILCPAGDGGIALPRKPTARVYLRTFVCL